jgi:hypothetical protein
MWNVTEVEAWQYRSRGGSGPVEEKCGRLRGKVMATAFRAPEGILIVDFLENN